jgi:hypothetical protein
MVAITRLLASSNGRPDGLMALMPTHVTAQLGQDKTRGFQVINRPWSVLEFLKSDMYKQRVLEDYVLILEGDHIILKPIPNLATADTPVGFFFPYMSPDQVPDHPRIVAKWYKGPREHVQPTGPSPAIMHKAVLETLTKDWFELSVELKRDRETDKCFGWVLEMWGYTIACARLGIKHKLLQQLQIEPAATWHQNVSAEDPYIYHYTFAHEYTHEGYPMVGQLGEWSFNKREYSAIFPACPMQGPPECAYQATKLLIELFNEGCAASPAWVVKATSGSRDTTRKPPPPALDASAPAYRAVVGTGPWEMIAPRWEHVSPNLFFFFEEGNLHTPIGSAKWSLSTDGSSVVVDFCGRDTLAIGTDESGRTLLRGGRYTFALARQHNLEQASSADPAMWQAPLAKRIIGAGPYSWGERLRRAHATPIHAAWFPRPPCADQVAVCACARGATLPRATRPWRACSWDSDHRLHGQGPTAHAVGRRNVEDQGGRSKHRGRQLPRRDLPHHLPGVWRLHVRATRRWRHSQGLDPDRGDVLQTVRRASLIFALPSLCPRLACQQILTRVYKYYVQ